MEEENLQPWQSGQNQMPTFMGLFSERQQEHQQIPMRNQGTLGWIKGSVAKNSTSHQEVLSNWHTVHLICTRTKGGNTV